MCIGASVCVYVCVSVRHAFSKFLFDFSSTQTQTLNIRVSWSEEMDCNHSQMGCHCTKAVIPTNFQQNDLLTSTLYHN